MKLLKLVALFTLLSLNLISYTCLAASSQRLQRTEEAYATLLYGDEFLLGVRVLGKSIRDTGSTKDIVVLVSDGVSDYAKKLLVADGWIVEKISLLANPNQVRPKRFWGVYTKLKIFNMTNYKKVVYLDADTIVVKSIEDLFKCAKFCANLKHSERLNSGVMVVEPSETVFNNMMSKVTTLPSYTGGDQGFLNSYYAEFPNAHVFQPDLPEEVRKTRPVPDMERLSTLYNADVGLYMLANKWMVDENELRVIHYTLGPLKPWDWWTSWLLKPVDVWQRVREQLDESLPGTGGGKNPKDELLVKALFLLPLCLVLLCYYRSFLQTRAFCRSSLCDHIRHLYYKIRSNGALAYTGISSSSAGNSIYQSKVPAYLGGVSIFMCFMAVLLALALGLSIVPRQVMPWTGLFLMYEWTFTIFFLLFGGFLHLIYLWGKRMATQAASLSSPPDSLAYDSRKAGHRQGSSCDVAAWYYGLGMALLAVAAPSLPCIFGVTALFLRLGLMVAGGLVLASFMTYASEHLAIRSFLRGFEDRDTARARNICF
ncbi:hypothetical protein OIU85_004813 [Salix viminalis]|uniref:Hexosyltransferase n=3 Tax=Salix TaxID=40685 RepID=A0A9Q0PTB0_SALVM|nr:hypothetical protein OIU77_004115 [Salix suchowensis]KAJ6379966.1 hypothetical protein OIU76_016594 [Salix suchowensis]KAJ6434168.1 hypothetical protein OIU84_017811 [Salix udensis]KAJ6434171.1 hypothetical protein OIU84_017811 [Salix udensis]KAJ6694060.1 hypothetical protein OIU85_004813 [Salix viminalis]